MERKAKRSKRAEMRADGKLRLGRIRLAAAGNNRWAGVERYFEKANLRAEKQSEARRGRGGKAGDE